MSWWCFWADSLVITRIVRDCAPPSLGILLPSRSLSPFRLGIPFVCSFPPEIFQFVVDISDICDKFGILEVLASLFPDNLAFPKREVIRSPRAS